ncbi:hypothetical protein [Breoghania sp.]|uniref:hypothetical protein n=1 Tax=Breoghania sp. TaxID=2065378 RepID=UPI003204941E
MGFMIGRPSRGVETGLGEGGRLGDGRFGTLKRGVGHGLADDDEDGTGCLGSR